MAVEDVKLTSAQVSLESEAERRQTRSPNQAPVKIGMVVARQGETFIAVAGHTSYPPAPKGTVIRSEGEKGGLRPGCPELRVCQ